MQEHPLMPWLLDEVKRRKATAFDPIIVAGWMGSPCAVQGRPRTVDSYALVAKDVLLIGLKHGMIGRDNNGWYYAKGLPQ